MKGNAVQQRASNVGPASHHEACRRLNLVDEDGEEDGADDNGCRDDGQPPVRHHHATQHRHKWARME